MRKDNLIGQRFGRLIVLEDSGNRGMQNNVYWTCLCDCGNTKIVRGDNLKSGNTVSCGCYKKENITIHGDSRVNKKTRLYNIWKAMKGRCHRSSTTNYKYYGAKGINVCDEWKNDYRRFKFWAILSGYQNDLTIDRINHKGNYEPENCQWLTLSENSIKAHTERREKWTP